MTFIPPQWASGPPLSLSRRRLIRSIPAALTLGAGTSMWTGGEANAQTNGFRALVCVFLFGGNDGINTIVPIDTAGYARYSVVRQGLALSQSSLVGLNSTLGLHPNLAALKPIWTEQKLALLCNVGPLARPMSQSDYLSWRDQSDTTKVPESLFSHADQQSLWCSASSSRMTLSGWGGRLLESLGAGSPVLSFAGNSQFGNGALSQNLALPGPGGTFGLNGYWSGGPPDARRSALNSLVNISSGNQLQTALSTIQRSAFEAGSRLSSVLAQAPVNGNSDPSNPEISAAFGNLSGAMNNDLSKQLYQVAKMIKNRGVVGGNRHLYFVSLGGFDNHTDQLAQHGRLMTNLGGALAAFYAATKSLGLQDSVTTFTGSDFGRTFKPNDSGGTDHAWGNQHLVLGGAVLGARSYGTYPSLLLGGQDDAGVVASEQQGRWIPGVSVDQYAATLTNWFAPELAGAGLSSVFPNLANFPTRDLGFMRSA